VCFGGLTLRPGKQRECYRRVIHANYPDLLPGYDRLYREARPSGQGVASYYARVDARFCAALGRRRLPGRIPRRLFHGRIPLYSEAGVLLEHRGFELDASAPAREPERRSTSRGQELARAGMAIQQWARRTIARRGRAKGFVIGELEAEFLAMSRDGSIGSVCGLSAPALNELRTILVGSSLCRPSSEP
jgi:hypothetical protein